MIGLYPNQASVRRLQEARAKGKRVFVKMAGPNAGFMNSDGTFNIDLWKANIDKWAGFDIASFIADGTIVGHYMIDEAHSSGTWGGRSVTAAELDEMARYSKQHWPNLPTVVRDSPTDLARHAGGWNTPVPGWSWQYLDVAWAQYNPTYMGSAGAFAAAQVSSANQQGLGLVMGLNVIDGGNGSSGISSASAPSSRRDGWAMSADEIRTYGRALMEPSLTCAFMIWRYYDSSEFSYWERPDIQAAMADLRNLAAQHPKTSCTR